MNPKRRIITSGGAALIAVMCSLVIASFLQRSSAQQSRRNRTQEWDYCAILNVQPKWPRENKDKYVGVATICYFRTSGCRREDVVFELTYADFLKDADAKQGESYNRTYAAPARAVESALSKAITKLGNDGWESVATDIIGIHDYDDRPERLVSRYATPRNGVRFQ